MKGMADAAAFNPLVTFDGLKSAGFSEPQARALTESLQLAMTARPNDQAIKTDIAVLRTDMAVLKAELLKAMADQQRWTVGIMAVPIGLTFAGLRLT